MRVFACHKERVVFEPRTRAPAKIFERAALSGRARRKEIIGRATQNRHLEINAASEVDGVFGEIGRANKVGFGQQSPIAQALETDQKRVAGERREALIRRVAIPRWVNRQNLPNFLPSSREEVGKLISVRAQIANAMASGQRRKVQQNSTTTGKPHSVTIRKTKRLGQGAESRTLAVFYRWPKALRFAYYAQLSRCRPHLNCHRIEHGKELAEPITNLGRLEQPNQHVKTVDKGINS
jgi:hypothetical protein